MGQAAAVDLPDPLEPGAANAAGSAAQADDLLAQLAGEEVDRLLAEAEVEPGPTSAREAPPSDSSSPITTPSTTESAAIDSRADELARELEADEALHGKLPSLNGTIADAQPQSFAAAEAPLPLYLRWLEWINAPLAMLPDSLRELAGKIALLTLFNAIALLIYLAIFGKHR